jgi:integrase
MPRLSTRLLSTERAIEKSKPKGRTTEYRITGLRGLVLRVSVQGTKSWVYNFKSPVTQQWRKKALGNYPTVSMSGAKEQALDILGAVRSGVDPLCAPPRSEITFEALADEYREAHRGRHTPKWSQEIERVLKVDVLPALNGHRAAGVSRHDVACIVEKVAARGSYASANLALKIVRGIFRWAVSSGRCEVDPTAGATTFPSKARERVLTDCEVRAAWSSTTEFRDAFRLQLLLGCRIGEVLGATKSEIDLDAAVWSIPATRVKSRRAHMLPLPPLAIEVLKGVLERAGASPWLFPSHQDSGALRTESAAQVLLRLNHRMCIEHRFTPHDLRRTCATRLGDMGVPDEVVSRVLGHAPNGVTRKHYNHSQRLDEVRQALHAWAEQVGNLVGGQ